MPNHKNPNANKLLRVLGSAVFMRNIEEIKPETTFDQLGMSYLEKQHALDAIGDEFLVPIPKSKRDGLKTISEVLAYVEKNPQVSDPEERAYRTTK